MMKTSLKIVIIVAFTALVAGAMAPKQGWCANKPTNDSPPAATTAVPAAVRLPKLLDLGATKCIPCKMMAPILEQLKKDYAGRLAVEFIDVWENPNAAKQYKIDLIPTQIFYSDSGKELFRHVGFYGRDDILAKWKELSIDLSPKPAPADSGKPSAASSPDKTKHD
ncbi:MAG: thioredoxin family protein [Verrucomicrobiia bacterium]